MPTIITRGAASATGFGFASLRKNIQYVGSQITAVDGSPSTVSISFSLTGGISSLPAVGDFVLVFVGVALPPSSTANPSVDTYTQNTAFGRTGTVTSVRMGIFYKFISGAETGIIVNSGGNALSAYSIYIAVFRGVNTTNPFDVATTTFTSVSQVNTASITPVTSGAYVIQHITYAHTRGLASITPSGVLDPKSAGFNDSYDVSSAGGYIIWTSGTIPAATWTFSGTPNAGYSIASASVALRP